MPTASSPSPGSSTCTPTCASRGARTPRPSRPAAGPRRSAASPPCTRWPTPIRSPTPPASSSRCGGWARRPAWWTSSPWARSPSGCGASGWPNSGRWPIRRRGCGGSPATAPAWGARGRGGGAWVSDPALMRRAVEYVKAFDGVVAQHAEEPRLTVGAQMHEGDRSARLGLPGWPPAAEEAIIARDVLLAGHVGARLHVCHVSTAGSVELLRWAKARGVQGTAEVTPPPLLLPDACAESYDPVFKVNPPLRTAEDVAALRAGLADGTIDAVATDHAPHAVEDKESEWAQARPGMLGLEQALSVVVETMVETGLLDWQGVADRMSGRPATIGRLGGHGRPLAPNEPGNLLLLDPATRAVVDPASLASRSRNSPYAGRELPGRVVATFLRGVPTVLDGKAQK